MNRINLSGILELDITLPGLTTTSVAGGVVTLVNVAVGATHSEPLTDGNSNFIFASGDVVEVIGIQN